MAIYRHRTLKEMAQDVAGRIAPVAPAPPELLVVSSFKQTLARIEALYSFPAVLVCAVGASYEDGEDPYADRDAGLNVFVVGHWQATEAADPALLDLVDAVALRFLPTGADQDNGDPEEEREDAWPGVVLQGVRYAVRRIQPVDAVGDRAAFAIQLDTTDNMAERGGIS